MLAIFVLLLSAQVSPSQITVGSVQHRQQHCKRLLHQRQTIFPVHRAGNVHQKHDVVCRVVKIQFLRRNADAKQLVSGVPRAVKQTSAERKAVFARRASVVVVEVVDILVRAFSARLDCCGNSFA